MSLLLPSSVRCASLLQRSTAGLRTRAGRGASRCGSWARWASTEPGGKSPGTKTSPVSAAAAATQAPGQGRGPITWASLALVGVVAGGSLWYYQKEKNAIIEKARQRNSRTIGKPLLGGPWTLVDHTGRIITDATLREDGHTHALLYFGFTYCPDICPAELIKMKEIIDKLDEDPEVGPVVRPVFISVDPPRDGVAQVAHYIKDFHPRTLGLTGTPEQVTDACKAYRVYHSVADQNHEDEEDYLVDHSIVMYLIGPDGMFIDFYTQMTEPEEAVQRIKDKILHPDPE